MYLILFVVGSCLGLAVGAGAVTWARLADDHNRQEELAEKVTSEIEALQERARRIERECMRWIEWERKNH